MQIKIHAKSGFLWSFPSLPPPNKYMTQEDLHGNYSTQMPNHFTKDPLQMRKAKYSKAYFFQINYFKKKNTRKQCTFTFNSQWVVTKLSNQMHHHLKVSLQSITKDQLNSPLELSIKCKYLQTLCFFLDVPIKKSLNQAE